MQKRGFFYLSFANFSETKFHLLKFLGRTHECPIVLSEYNNDFSNWVYARLHDQIVAEHRSIIDHGLTKS